jgi:hypothetical protein
MKRECSTNDSRCHHRHCWFKIAIAFGLANALGLLILGLLGDYYGYGLMMISTIASIYPGYAPTLAGSFIGAFWGFCDLFLFFLVAGFIYCILNKLCSKGCSSSSCDTDSSSKNGCCDVTDKDI